MADDATGEFYKTAATTVVGDWFFVSNTDGGVMTGFPLPGNWEVTIQPTFGVVMTDWEMVDGDSSLIPLGLNQSLILRAHDGPAACRLDCTVPKCGDGVLDGGETCDDGNTVGSDGCAADCSSLAG